MREKTTYYLSMGDKGIFYTLRKRVEKISCGQHEGESVVKTKDHFVKQLSYKLDLAQSKAEIITGYPVTEMDEKLKSFLRLSEHTDWTTFQFGKYKGQAIEDVYRNDPKYVAWVATYFPSDRMNKNVEHCRIVAAETLRRIKEEKQKEIAEKMLAEKKSKEDSLSSKYIGKEGQRIEIDLHVLKKISWPTPYEPALLYIMTDQNKNQLIWKTSYNVKIKLEEGQWIRLKLTIKKHKMYKRTFNDGDVIKIEQTRIARPVLIKKYNTKPNR